MTYDRHKSHILYPDIPPPVKAFIAHYYGVFDPNSAQPLLDQAINEHQNYSLLAQDYALQESEPNDDSGSAFPLQTGKPVVGALSSHAAIGSEWEENFKDKVDWYEFKVGESDIGRELKIELTAGSIVYQNFYYTNGGGTQYDGDVKLHLVKPSGSIVESNVDEFPSMTFNLSEAGTYYIAVMKDENHSRAVYKDYLLTVRFTGNSPSALPTFTASPTPTLIQNELTPTPVPVIYDKDLAVERVYLVIDDGGGSFEDDVEIDNPDLGQRIRFVSAVENTGRTAIAQYRFECYVDGQIFASGESNQNMSVGAEEGQQVFIYDNAEDTSGDLTGQTDFDPVDHRSITIAWDAQQGSATGWHIYIRKGFGGSKFLGLTNDGETTRFNWNENNPTLSNEFANGPDFNSIYSFRVIRIDGQLNSDDFFDTQQPVGFNLEDGNPVSLAKPEMPNLDPQQISIYDDILGGNDLAPSGTTGTDIDTQESRNFDVDEDTINEYHVLVSVDGGDFQFLGQTQDGTLRYFWWTPNNLFRTNSEYANGPQDGHTYQFKVVLIPLTGNQRNLLSGTLEYHVSD